MSSEGGKVNIANDLAIKLSAQECVALVLLENDSNKINGSTHRKVGISDN